MCSVLLDSTVDPPFLIKHIVTMAAHKDVPVILVPFLSSIMLESLKFSAIAVGFKVRNQFSKKPSFSYSANIFLSSLIITKNFNFRKQ